MFDKYTHIFRSVFTYTRKRKIYNIQPMNWAGQNKEQQPYVSTVNIFKTLETD